MKEKIIFREMLNEIKILADKKGNRITKEEIKELFKNAHLEEEHYTLIYEYLDSQKIQVQDFQPQKDDLQVKAAEEAEKEEEDAYVAMYLKDLENVVSVTEEEELNLFERAAAGDDLAKASLIEQYLHTVYQLSRNYSNHKIPLADIIQEGNVGLMLAAHDMGKKQNLNEYRAYLNGKIEDAIQDAVREQEVLSEMDEEMAVRVNHLSEAVQNLELDLEHKVSLDELSAYLEMPVDEIKDVLRMAGDEIEIEGEISGETHEHE